MDGGTSADHEVQRLRLEVHGPGLSGAAAAAVAEAASVMGVDDVVPLAVVVRDLCDQVVASSYDSPADAVVAVSVSVSGGDHRVLVRLDDEGRPGAYHGIDVGPDSELGRRRGLVEAVHVTGRGHLGNRVELALRPRHHDVRAGGDAAGRDTEPVAADATAEIRFAGPDDAEGIAVCVYECYGYSYEIDWLYEPEAIAARLEAHTLRSVIGVDDDGHVVGHLGLAFESVRDHVGEAGMAVVDPRWRGHHLFTTMKRHMATWAADAGLAGMFSEATAAHPYSQKANIELGAVETGLLVGYIPAQVGYVGIDAGAHRQSVALFYLRTGDGPERAAHVPPQHREMIGEIVDRSRLRCHLVDEPPGPSGPSRIRLTRRPDHNQATLLVEAVGADLPERVAPVLARLRLDRVDTIYADLPLIESGTAHVVAGLEEEGFVFGGVFPNRHVDGDVLRLQYLNNVDPHTDDIATASAFGERLKDYVVSRVGS